MLSVHRHCHSWNARANELRAGRWVQGPAEFEPNNLETPFSLSAVSNGPLLTRHMGFEFFSHVTCAKQVVALWSESFLDSDRR